MKHTKCTGAVVYAITPYDPSGAIDFEAFRSYIQSVAEEDAHSIVISSNLGDIGFLSMQERGALVKTAAETAGDQAMIIATVIPGEMSPGAQAAFYLEKGADAINIRFPTNDIPGFTDAFQQVIHAGADYIVVTDYKSGGFDMNMSKGPRPVSGLPEDLIVKLFEEHDAFRSLIIALPLNECGPKTSRLVQATGGKLNIIAETATDQMLEQLDRGAEGFVTGVFVKFFNTICRLYAEGGADRARPLFFDLLRVIVWTKQYVDREPYLYQKYLQNKGIVQTVKFRTERYIDAYISRYGEDMLELVKKLEADLPKYI